MLFNYNTHLSIMSKKDFQRYPGSVFVNVPAPESVQQQQRVGSYFSEWSATAIAIGAETPIEEPQPEPIPTADELLVSALPQHIESSRWGFYVIPNSQSRVFDGTTFVYHNPSAPFWNLYNLAKGIFRDLGIRLARVDGVWKAHIPIPVLTDKVFVKSGLEAVERRLRTRTDDDRSIASKISDSIRHRQFENTKRGMAKVKQMREGLADAVGLVAIIGSWWLAYIL